MFKVARRVAKDRVISTVDPQARHGHKSSARGFDGYKGHIAIDPHSELITDTVVSAGNVGDAVDQRRAPTMPGASTDDVRVHLVLDHPHLTRSRRWPYGRSR
ncbi:unannotated protein [freshwater metagenome]|uniref:Unannotated protein n=1 Tax=freshwater metagenome TaxID=449393 RepID=A0A6J7LHY7_9ZZZZ